MKDLRHSLLLRKDEMKSEYRLFCLGNADGGSVHYLNLPIACFGKSLMRSHTSFKANVRTFSRKLQINIIHISKLWMKGESKNVAAWWGRGGRNICTVSYNSIPLSIRLDSFSISESIITVTLVEIFIDRILNTVYSL